MTPAMEKWDAKKSLPSYRARAGRLDLIEIPTLRYLAVDAVGDPDTPPTTPGSFAAAVQSLYPLAFAIKFASKTTRARDYVVPPLEALWWADGMDAFTTHVNREAWKSTVLLMLPEWIDAELIDAGRDKASAKVEEAALEAIRVETLEEGLACQTLHVGPFAEEGPVIEGMHEHITAAGMDLTGKHHEIYLSDFRRVAPEKWRTIVRQPAARRG